MLAGGCNASDQRIVPASAKSLERSFFGMHIHRADSTTAWPVANFGSWRLWDAAVSWQLLEPTKGVWRFERLDKLVGLALGNGVEPLLTLGITPRWAASKPDEPFVYGLGGNSRPRDIGDWETYVRTVATRYKGRVRYYELWNEPTFEEIDKGKGFYAGDVDSMVALGRVAYRVLKEIDPENRLLSPGFTDGGARLDLYLKRGGREITDIVAHHFYEARPENIPGVVAAVRAVMARYGLENRPLWDTETGYGITASSKDGPVDDTELGGFIARAHVLAAAAGLDRFYYYSWEGMLERRNKQTMSSPVVTAYTQTLRWLNGVSVKACSSQDRRLWICELSLGQRTAYMVWNTQAVTQWKPPVQWQAVQYETLDARLVKLEPDGEIPVGQAPVLVKSDTGLWSVYNQASEP